MRDKKVSQRHIHLWWKSGFTLVELMVVMVIVSIIITSIIGVMLSTRKTAKWSEVLIEAQQNARFACDVMAADIRCAGYGIDASLVQGAIVYAGPFEIIFNANMTPYPDTIPPQEPGAININMSPKNVPPGSSPVHYSPGQTFSTGAETFRYTIDYNDDGVISAVDKTSPEATRTTNPNDYLLIKQVYGELWDGINGGENQELAVIRGPDVWPGQTTGIPPLFEYWLDHDNDPTTPDILFGDTDNSGDLSFAEINALNTQVPNPDRITRVTINVIGETREPYTGGKYRQVIMTTAINTLRNNPPQFRLIKGHIYLDADTNGVFDLGEVGVDSILISLHTAQTCYTGLGGLLQGMYEFSVLPGSYTVKVTIPAGYALTTASSFVAYAKTRDVDSTSANLFGVKTVALGYLTGVVFDDSLCTNGKWDPDSGEQPIPGVKISVTNTPQITYTDDTGHYFFEVNAESIYMHIVTEADPDSYISTAADTIPSAGAFYFPIGPNDVAFWVMEGCTAKINFGDKKGASGKIKGLVFEDVGTAVDSLYEPADGDTGIPNVLIEIRQGVTDDFVTSTRTDADGSFSVIVPINPIPDPTYNVIETDPGGFNSINSNRVEGLRIPNEGDSVIVRPFADKRVIIISLQGKALTVITPDLREDTDVDNDIVMGKGKNGENLLVWYNQYLSPGNPPPEDLFNPNRDDARTCDKTIHALSANPINDDNLHDVVSVMGSPTDNIWVWFTRTGPPKKYKGKLPSSPNKIYSTLTAGEKASSVATGLLGTPRIDIPFNDSYFDIAVGTHKGEAGKGVLEVWLNQRPDSIALLATDPVDVHETAGASDLGEVKGIAIADVVGAGGGTPDDRPDIILATITGANTGEIVIFRNKGTPGPGNFSWHKTLPASGEVNCIAVLDLLEDVNNDIDIVIGTRTGNWTGKVEIWHNNNDGTFGNADASPTYIAEAGGAVQCIGLARLYPDVYPDVVVGLKTSENYTGKVLLYDLAYGKFPIGGPTDPAGGFYTGEMVTLSIADFDKDGKNDFIIGERTSATVGHLLIFFQ